MTAAQRTGILHDRVLADQARHGDRQAYDELVRRHAPTAWRFAVAVARDRGMAAAALATGLGTTLAVAPTVASNQSVRAQLLAAVRQAAADPALVPLELDKTVAAAPGPVGIAFASLPERWRSGLWLVDVEAIAATDAALALGVPAAGVAPLVTRARAGLAEQVINVHADDAADDVCRRTLDRLSDYAAGRLTARDEGRIRRHLDGCDRCDAVLADLDDVTPVLRGLILAVPLEVVDATADRWSAALVRTGGPLHLTLPSGRPVPAWAERTVAGAAAAAAVVALGISSAILAAGRGGRVRDDGLARSVPAEAPYGAADGESALGGTSGLSGLLDGVRVPSSDPLDVVVPGAVDAVPHITPGTTPAGVSGLVPSVSPPAPSAGSSEPAGPATTPPPGTEPMAEPMAEVIVGVGDVIGVTIGDQCTGVELSGTVLGCAPATADAPIQVDTDGSLLSGLGL